VNDSERAGRMSKRDRAVFTKTLLVVVMKKELKFN
jgi:hypothetical protein